MGAEWWMRRPKTNVGSEHLKDGLLTSLNTMSPAIMETDTTDDVHGVVKARASTNNVSFIL